MLSWRKRRWPRWDYFRPRRVRGIGADGSTCSRIGEHMSRVTVQFLGSGDAFGSGGRFQPCVRLELNGRNFFVDFGASSMIAVKRDGVDTSTMDAIVLTHLHGDHFGGIPFLLLHEQLIASRTGPILIAGPPGVKERIEAAMEVFFPGSSKINRRFPISYLELFEKTPARIGGLTLTPFAVNHQSGAPSYAFRFECGGKIVGFSGDTEWTDSLIEVASEADLFICEAYFRSKKVKYHLDYATLMENRARLACRRIVLTHMSEDLLSKMDDIELECVEDGGTIVLD